MHHVRLFLAATAASLCALAGQAGAQTFAASAVRVEHAAAIVTVIPEDRADIHVAIAPGTRLAAPTVRMSGEGVVIDGGLGSNRIRGCMSLNNRTQVRIA